MHASLLLLAVLAVATDSASLVLVEDGKPRCSIVVPDDAPPTVNHAAVELAAYLQRISGAEVPIIPEGRFERGGRIDVGATQRARALLPDGFLDEQERVLIRSDHQGAVICGGGERGTLFAVYRFLELLGCRWLTPDLQDEIVPRQSKIVVRDLQLDTKPAFQWRPIGRIGGVGRQSRLQRSLHLRDGCDERRVLLLPGWLFQRAYLAPDHPQRSEL